MQPPSVWSKLKSEDVKKFITEPIKKKQSKLLRRSAILGAGAVGTGLLVDRAKQKKGGSVKTSKYNKGGGVRKSKYSL